MKKKNIKNLIYGLLVAGAFIASGIAETESLKVSDYTHAQYEERKAEVLSSRQ